MEAGLVPGPVAGATFYPRSDWAARAMRGAGAIIGVAGRGGLGLLPRAAADERRSAEPGGPNPGRPDEAPSRDSVLVEHRHWNPLPLDRP
mgnify:CR=1 FL=1